MKSNRNHKKVSLILFIGIFAILIGSTYTIIGTYAIAPEPIYPTYRGYVRNTSGTGLSNAIVRLYSGGVQVSIDYTDANGYYTVGNDYVSSPYLKVEKSGYITQTKSVSTSGGYYNFYLVSMALPTYVGTVRSNLGGALSNALVRLYSGGVQVSSDYTDSNGYYTVGNDYVTSPTITVEKMGYVTQTKSVSTSGGSYNFDLGVYYALIIGGSVDERFTRDAFEMHNTLRLHYGFTEDRIYLLTTRDTIDGKTVPRDKATTHSNIVWAINQIKGQIYSCDEIIVWWTGHGSPELFESGSMWDLMWSFQLSSYLSGVSCHRMYIFLGPCHSGSFIDDLDESNRAIYTSCGYWESGGAWTTHSAFPWATYRGLDPDLNADDADTNNDNRVSLYELFNYCTTFVQNTFPTQHPQRWVGSAIGSDSSAYIGDGYY